MKTMKRVSACIVALSLAISCTVMTSFAADDEIRVMVPSGAGSREVQFSADLGYPYADENERTMVPMRAVGEALGLSVSWDGASQSAVFTEMIGLAAGTTVTFPVGASTYTVTNGTQTQQRSMDTVTVEKDGRTYAPIRYLAQAFGYAVEWDDSSHTVTISNDWDAQTTANMALFFDAMEEAKYIVNRPHAYEEESFNAYFDLFEANYWMNLSSRNVLDSEEDMGMVYALLGAREALVQIVDDPEETIWYIWGEDMPESEDAGNRDYTYAYDRGDFKPFLVPYLLEDQSQVKGNIIVVAGGGYALRSNSYEGYAIAERFNELGYNTFVLQRRVAPSAPLDAHLDLQRAIRYIRYYADEYGIAKTDLMAACGFSGGASTISGTIADCYGYMLPTVYYPDYQCDEIDRVNADLQSALLIYGAAPLDTENPNLPDVFMAIGSADTTVDPQNHVDAIEYYASKGVRYEAHFFADMTHGFGGEWGFDSETFTNYETPVASVWPEMADTFLSVQWGYTEPFTQHIR